MVRNNLTKVPATRSHRAELSFFTLLSRSCWRQDVPIRANVSFSVVLSALAPQTQRLKRTLTNTDTEQVEKAIVIGHDWWVHRFTVCTCRLAYGCCAQGKCSCLAFGELLPRAFQGVRVLGHWLLGDIRWVRVRGIPSVDQAGSWLRDIRILGVRPLSESWRPILTHCRFFVEDGANRLIEEHVSPSQPSLTAMRSSRHGSCSSNPGSV